MEKLHALMNLQAMCSTTSYCSQVNTLISVLFGFELFNTHHNRNNTERYR